MEINLDTVNKYMDYESFIESFEVEVCTKAIKLLKMMEDYDEDGLIVNKYAVNIDTKYYFCKYACSCDLIDMSEKFLRVNIYERWAYGGYDEVGYTLPTSWLFDYDKAVKEFAIQVAHERTKD